MLKIAYYTVVALLMALCLAVMNGGDYFKKPHSDLDNVELHLSRAKVAVENKHWNEANQHCQALNIAWEKIKPRIQFSVEKDEMNAIDVGLARLDSYIRWEEQTEAWVELTEIESHWHNLEK